MDKPSKLTKHRFRYGLPIRDLASWRARLPAIAVAAVLVGCGGEPEQEAEVPVRGLKTVLIKESEETTERRYPSVLQPAEVSTLSFEVSGRLTNVDLDVGQRVKEGDILAAIDTTSLQLQLESAEAALRQAEATARNAAEDLKRKEELLEKGVTTKATVDQSRTTVETSTEQVAQARKQVETAQTNMEKAELRAPYDGIINTVEVESFANVAAGAVVATLYTTDTFETSFSVSYDVVNRIAVGKKASVRLADNPEIVLPSYVSELGSRADTVSSFPVVVTLEGVDPSMKAGMAVEIALEFPVPRGQGFTLPLSVLPFEGEIDSPDDPNAPAEVPIYVYDEATSTVKKRLIKIGGVRENALIAVDGLELGERVASAGVSFLRDGQKVKLLPDTDED